MKSRNRQVDLEKSPNYSSRLREERIRLCPKQLDFSTLSGIDNALLSALETGKQKIRADHLEPLADAGIDILYVVTGRRSAGLMSSVESRIINAAKQLDSPALEAFALIAERAAGKV